MEIQMIDNESADVDGPETLSSLVISVDALINLYDDGVPTWIKMPDQIMDGLEVEMIVHKTEQSYLRAVEEERKRQYVNTYKGKTKIAVEQCVKNIFAQRRKEHEQRNGVLPKGRQGTDAANKLKADLPPPVAVDIDGDGKIDPAPLPSPYMERPYRKDARVLLFKALEEDDVDMCERVFFHMQYDVNARLFRTLPEEYDVVDLYCSDHEFGRKPYHVRGGLWYVNADTAGYTSTALHVACYYGSLEIIKWLLWSKFANPQIADILWRVPAQLAMYPMSRRDEAKGCCSQAILSEAWRKQSIKEVQLGEFLSTWQTPLYNLGKGGGDDVRKAESRRLGASDQGASKQKGLVEKFRDAVLRNQTVNDDERYNFPRRFIRADDDHSNILSNTNGQHIVPISRELSRPRGSVFAMYGQGDMPRDSFRDSQPDEHNYLTYEAQRDWNKKSLTGESYIHTPLQSRRHPPKMKY